MKQLDNVFLALNASHVNSDTGTHVALEGGSVCPFAQV